MSQKSEDTQERVGTIASINDTAIEKHHLTGLRLFALLGSLTLVTFLVLLDLSIIGTVCALLTPRSKSVLLI
jgi:hypothetical protein